MKVHHQKNQHGHCGFKTRKHRNLLLGHGIKHVRHAQTHLKSHHRTCKLNGSKHESPNQTHHQANQ